MKKEKKQHKKINWKEYIYNSPYLIMIILTSMLVMVFSEEIGIPAIAREAQLLAREAHAKMPVKQEQEVVSTEYVYDAGKDGTAGVLTENTQQETGADGMSREEAENAGICKDEENNISDDNEGIPDLDDTETHDKAEDAVVGTTNYEYYDPIPIDSRYYKDAGKIALTTEYPYTKENISYFNDAVFLGDSRTLGISDYAGLEEADFYCDSGMMIFKLLEEGVTCQKTGKKVDLKEVLQEKQYGKVYIMLGMNELGYGNTEMYLEQYRKVLDQIREWQPGAIIYIMANLHVSSEKNNLETEFNNININDKNAASASLANGTDIFYLDANPLFTDEEGFLKAELTFDGVHLYAKHYDAWREFLLEHAVEPGNIQRNGEG